MAHTSLEPHPKRSISLRLSTLPALAALTVLIIAGLSSWDLLFKKRGSIAGVPVLNRPVREGLVPRSRDLEELSEEEALKAIAHTPGRAAVMRLWREPAHHGRLRELLLTKETREGVRLWLLGRFAEEESRIALEAARAIALDGTTPQGHLLSSAYEVLSRYGATEDMPLFFEREFEHHQTRASREKYRDSLRERTDGRE